MKPARWARLSRPPEVAGFPVDEEWQTRSDEGGGREVAEFSAAGEMSTVDVEEAAFSERKGKNRGECGTRVSVKAVRTRSPTRAPFLVLGTTGVTQGEPGSLHPRCPFPGPQTCPTSGSGSRWDRGSSTGYLRATSFRKVASQNPLGT